MQQRAMSLRQFHRQGGGTVASLGVANARVGGCRNTFTEALSPARQVGFDPRRVFAMAQQQGRNAGEQALQGRQVVHQHVAGGGAHEHLHRGDIAWIEGGHGVEVVAADAEVETVVGHAMGGGEALLFRQRFEAQRRRAGIGHVHETGDAARHGGAGFAGDRALLWITRLAEVHLVVDHSRQQVASGGIDLPAGAAVFQAAGDAFDATVADQQIAFAYLPLVDHPGIADQQALHVQNSFCSDL